MCITIYRRIAVAMAADGRGWPWSFAAVGRPRELPWQLPRTSVVIAAMRMAVEIATADSVKTAVAIAADFRGLPWLVRRTLPRTEPRHVRWPQPWYLPWKCHEPWHMPWQLADFHGSPWHHPRKSTETPRSLPRTSAKKSNNVHP